MRRRGHIGGRARHLAKRKREEHFAAKGQELEVSRLEHVEQQLEAFRVNLEKFARKYREKIKQDPGFRRQFQIMCARIGVDPLASTKGFWAEMLGVGEFYTELGIQIIDICVSTRRFNGGLIDTGKLIELLKSLRGSNAVTVSSDDIERAVKQLKVLGSGFKCVQAGAKSMVVSVPVELNRDHSALLHASQQHGGFVTLTMMAGGMHRWSTARTERALQTLLDQGMCWIDRHPGEETRYFFPSVWKQANVASAIASQ